MIEKPGDRPVLGRGAAAVSLIALVACALASDALAKVPPTEDRPRERELTTRVVAIVDQIRFGDPTLAPALPPSSKMAQWQNL
jgi:hypothetical protein